MLFKQNFYLYFVKKIGLFYLCCLFICAGYAQENAFNYGIISIQEGTLMSVRGNFSNEMNGVIKNEDSLFLWNNFSNNNANGAFDTLASKGFTILSGGKQTISGKYPPHFTALETRGGGVKSTLLPVYVHRRLKLNANEFSMDTFTLWVMNPAPTAISNTTGFVSALKNGGLNRSVQTKEIYFYPLGSSIGTSRYQPLEIAEYAGSPTFIQARFVNNNVDADQLPATNFQDTICYVHPNWYHRIWSNGSGTADIRIYKDAVLKTPFNLIANYNSGWKLTTPNEVADKSINIQAWKTWNNADYVLAYAAKPLLDAGPDTFIAFNDSIQLTVQGNGNYTWTGDNLSCNNCPNPFAGPKTTTTYTVKVTDNIGCTASDDITVNVLMKNGLDLKLPNVFTPNGDGVNDKWNVSVLNLYPQNHMKILNRYGDVLFEKASYIDQFDGTNQSGENLPEGSYFFYLEVKNPYTQKMEEYAGPLTILR